MLIRLLLLLLHRAACRASSTLRIATVPDEDPPVGKNKLEVGIGIEVGVGVEVEGRRLRNERSPMRGNKRIMKREKRKRKKKWTVNTRHAYFVARPMFLTCLVAVRTIYRQIGFVVFKRNVTLSGATN